MSNIINKVKDAVHHGDKHSSHENRGTTGAGYGSNTTGTTGTGYGEDPRSSNHGPHSSNIGNKVDPRVDSDRDNRATGGYGSTTTGTGYGSGTTGTTGGGYGENLHSSNHGPHSSNIGNKADPRVDSDLDNRATGGYDSGTTGAGYGSGAGYGAGTTSGDRSYQAPGSGNTRDTAGPHNSNLLNKADPRVDSDLDGSNTYGGNATYQ